MKLSNRFDEAEKHRVWEDHKFCAVCKSNQNCSLHHVDSVVSSSIYNSIMLCDKHHREADSHNTNSPLSAEFRKKLRDYTFRLIEKQGKIRTEDDNIYIASHQTS